MEYIRNDLNIANGYQSPIQRQFCLQRLLFLEWLSGTGACDGKQCPAGDANLELLTGAMSGFAQSKQQQNALRAPIPSIYAQDTFHATRHLTLIAGIRWEPEYYPTDYFHRGVVFNYADLVANVYSTVYPNAPAGVRYYGDPGVPAALTNSSPWQFSPNIGVSTGLYRQPHYS